MVFGAVFTAARKRIGHDAALAVGETRLDPSDRSASHQGDDLGLTSAEFNVLRLLLARAGSVVDKDTLSQEALGRPLAAYDRSIDVRVTRLRKKIEPQPDHPQFIRTVWGKGYLFAPEGDAP